jgi:hypothetical protein
MTKSSSCARFASIAAHVLHLERLEVDLEVLVVHLDADIRVARPQPLEAIRLVEPLSGFLEPFDRRKNRHDGITSRRGRV